MISLKSTKGVGSPAKRDIPLIVFGGGLLLFVIMVISFFPMTLKIKDDTYIKELESRITFLENRVLELSPALEYVKEADIRERRLDSLNTACQRLEASLTLKSNLLINRMDRLESGIHKAKTEKTIKSSEPPVVPSVVKKDVQKAPKKAKRFHVVKKGDTFYSISRAHSLTLQRLKELNQFNEKTIIYPGQKIIVAP
ncbi:MAG: LysM peptidoglycan-binding domain-containing protein [Proteobacteria bacterium]|nr:LysM peptidoglycan-binding domain-containing protein [Pseudomonadota bacterium]